MKALLIFMVLSFVSYPPLELSRLIFTKGLTPELLWELMFIWGTYGMALLVVVLFFDYKG